MYRCCSGPARVRGVGLGVASMAMRDRGPLSPASRRCIHLDAIDLTPSPRAIGYFGLWRLRCAVTAAASQAKIGCGATLSILKESGQPLVSAARSSRRCVTHGGRVSQPRPATTSISAACDCNSITLANATSLETQSLCYAFKLSHSRSHESSRPLL